MTPLSEGQPKAEAPRVDCLHCEDYGFTMPGEFHRTEWTPAGVIFRYGVPCRCAAGAEFASRQAAWNKPITDRWGKPIHAAV